MDLAQQLQLQLRIGGGVRGGWKELFYAERWNEYFASDNLMKISDPLRGPLSLPLGLL